ncbi:cytochrome c biogenesis heme-transporting ATPase CcmA [Gammaproteobacteria bacterium]|nr:cytochrome c biogenesis heme-transporting ATPase CcmA [Gammaproteobacteria bacterium]
MPDPPLIEPISLPYPDPQIDVIDLACERGEVVLFEQLSFSIRGGNALHIAGRNGAGKTTLLRQIAGLGWPHHGEIRWRGAPIQSDPIRWRSAFTLIAHAPMLKDALTPVANLRFALALEGRAVSTRAIVEALEQMGLVGYEDLQCRSLSAGQKRRVALARLAISTRPVWLLDEPLTALDVDGRATVARLIDTHIANGGITIYSSHQALDLSDDQRQQSVVLA